MPGYVTESRNYKMPDLKRNPNQEKAIMHTVGAAQVFAGPGSGKTYVIVERIRSLITRHGVDPAHILVITFTKAAALEMQERFFRSMKPDRPPVWFGTFHALFYHILKKSAQYREYSIITESQKIKLLRQIVRLHQRFSFIREEDLGGVSALVSHYKTTSCVGPVTLQKIGEEDIVFLAGQYQCYLEEFRQMDFDDLALYCRSLLTSFPETLSAWRTQFQYIMIDEFQDISPDQYEIIKLLADPLRNLFIVGDDDQSIYGFRGASPDSMRQFMNDYADAKRIFLDVNYRCSKSIVEASLLMISENQNRVEKQINAAHKEGEGFRLRILEGEAEEESCLLESLKDKQMSGTLGQCALLCRTNFDCALWAQNLRRGKIPFVMKEAAANPFEHFVIRDIMAYLSLAQGEMERRHFLRIMNRPVRYLKRDSARRESISEEELLQYYVSTPVLQERVRKLFFHLRSMGNKKLCLQIHYIRKVIGYDGYLQEKYGAKEAEKLIRTAVEFQKFSERFQTPKEIGDYIRQYDEAIQSGRKNVLSSINRCAENLQHKPLQPQENKKEAIHLLTMHASKGLEFDTVYLPDCQEGKIPYSRSCAPEEIEEERRMFYVAMTRAKRELCLYAYQGKSGKDIPSRFLKCFSESHSSTSSSNSAVSRYSSKASATASYSSSSSI